MKTVYVYFKDDQMEQIETYAGMLKESGLVYEDDAIGNAAVVGMLIGKVSDQNLAGLEEKAESLGANLVSMNETVQ